MTTLTVFITSKRIDSDVEEAARQFEEAGFTVQMRETLNLPDLDSPTEDQDSAGTAAQRTIDAIRNADAMVVLNGSDWGRMMHEERAIAVAFDKPVITVDSRCYLPSTTLDFHPRVRPFRSVTVELRRS